MTFTIMAAIFQEVEMLVKLHTELNQLAIRPATAIKEYIPNVNTKNKNVSN